MRRTGTLALFALLAGGMLGQPALARSAPDPLEMLENSDANRDGVVTRAEFIDARRERFAKMDRNRDGHFTDEDLPRMVRNRAGERIDRLTAGLDANRDGRISYAEFVNGPTRLFDLGDQDGDGRLDRHEMERLRALAAARKAR